MNKIFVIYFLLVFLTSITFAGTVNLPKTGQTKCWDQNGTEISCSGTGQDGEIQAGVAWPGPRFTDNGNGTVSDNLTGLMWTKDANLPNGTKTWQESLDYVAAMNAGTYTNYGYSDWRLPNVNELESLINANEGDNSTWLNSQRFTSVQSYWYWSSTTSAWNTDYAFDIDMFCGSVSNYYKSKSYNHYVWPVRAGLCESFVDSVIFLPQTGQTTSYRTGDDGEIQAGVAWPEPRFTVNADTTITDNLTGLVWAPDGNLMSTRDPEWDNDGGMDDGGVSWQHTLDYVAKLNSENYLGHTDWHLPNHKELFSLIDYSQNRPALPAEHPFTNVQAFYYWSSTSVAGVPSIAWVVRMWDGIVGPIYKSDYYCV